MMYNIFQQKSWMFDLEKVRKHWKPHFVQVGCTLQNMKPIVFGIHIWYS